MERSHQKRGVGSHVARESLSNHSSISSTKHHSRRSQYSIPEEEWEDKHGMVYQRSVSASQSSSILAGFSSSSNRSRAPTGKGEALKPPRHRNYDHGYGDERLSQRSSSGRSEYFTDGSRQRSRSSSSSFTTEENSKFNRVQYHRYEFSKFNGATDDTKPKGRRVDFEITSLDVNERNANSKLAAQEAVGSGSSTTVMNSTESMSPEEIFFSRVVESPPKEANPLTLNKYTNTAKDISVQKTTAIRSSTDKSKTSKGSVDKSSNATASGTSSSCLISSFLTYPTGVRSSEKANGAGSFGKTLDENKKCNINILLSCIGVGSCVASNNAPVAKKDRPVADVDKFPSKELVKEMRVSWAEKHRPGSLAGFICQKQQAQLLKQLVSHGNCPHILFQGPPGAGKKALTMALLRDIYGGSAWRVSHELRSFEVQGKRSGTVNLPIAASPHHIELNVLPAGESARYVLMTLVKELARNSEIALLEEYESSFAADYKVMVLYEVERLSKDVQHIIKWMMDRYTDAVKLILCSDNDSNLVDAVKNRCQVIKVDTPVTHEIMEVLLHIAKKERFDLPMSFAARIASRSKQNLRRAIMSLEACKAHQYPFQEDQPIPMGWEEIVMEIATDILTDPTSKRVFLVRGKIQRLLSDCVDPKLILQTLMEELIKRVPTCVKKEFYSCYSYSQKHLLKGNVLIKLEEFVSKVIAIYGNHLKERSPI